MADNIEEALSSRRVWWEVQTGEIDEALRAADNGVFISHEAMSAWLNSWGTDHEATPPEADVIKAKR